MNFGKIIEDLAHVDQEVFLEKGSRRGILKSFGSKVFAATVPLAVGAFIKKSDAKTSSSATLVAALNFLLELEYMQYTFFMEGIHTGGLIPAADVAGYQTIVTQDEAHIAFLINTITGMSGTAFLPKHYTDPTTSGYYVPAAYDFTAAGVYADVFSNYLTFIALGEVIKDTAVHAVKGQLPALISASTLFIQGMELQCTEARHAAHIRLIRHNNNVPDYPSPWITNNISPTINSSTTPFQNFYNGDNGADLGEDNVAQNGVNIGNLTDTHNTAGVIPQVSATAAFDETMDETSILSLLSPFILA